MKKKSKGFTLIELIIVVVIIGILATLAIGAGTRAKQRHRQSEAKQILNQIYVMEQAYYLEYGEYWGNGVTASADNPNAFDSIGVEIPSDARYTYSIAPLPRIPLAPSPGQT